MTSLVELLADAEPVADGFRTTIPPNWLQGRTAYGGLSGALALHAAQHSDTDLPPLRSATVNFIGPLAGEVTVTATRLRRGRNAAFVQSDIVSEAGLGLRATYVFMHGRQSRVSFDQTPRAPVPAPAADVPVYTGPGEFFTGNFDFLDVKDRPGAAEWLRWVRLRERAALDPMIEVLAVADALPPAAFKLFGKQPAPLSTLTWTVNLLATAPATDDGWWLLGATADFARHGCTSQTMRVWNAAGDLLAEGMQSVAIFA